MAKYKIERNPQNGGLYAFFVHDGQEYYADLCFCILYTECMIFTSKDQEVTDWGELYCKRNIDISEEALTACIDEFIEQLDS